MNLIDIKPAQLLELLKSSYYAQYGEQIEIGSDEFAAASAQAYAWSLFLANVNEATRNIFLETANREWLVRIAAQYGIGENVQYRAMSYFSVTFSHSDHEYPAGSVRVSDGAGHVFENIRAIKSPSASVYGYAVLYAESPGIAYNGIPTGDISTPEADAVTHAQNLTESAGGLDGFPDTDAGTEEFREYIKNAINTFAGAGTALAYAARAKASTCLPGDVHVIGQDETGYEKGKVKIWVYGKDGAHVSELVDCVDIACADPSFRPIGDLVEVRASPQLDRHLSIVYCVTYETRFAEVAQARSDAIISAYLEELRWNMDRAFRNDELCHRMCAADDDGVYATDCYAVGMGADDFPIVPTPGRRLNIDGVTAAIQYR